MGSADDYEDRRQDALLTKAVIKPLSQRLYDADVIN